MRVLSVRLFIDSYFVDDVMSSMSLLGIQFAIHGPSVMFPFQRVSGKQCAAYFSTFGSEFIAVCLGYREAMVPATVLRNALTPPMVNFLFVAISGRNPIMRVRIQWLYGPFWVTSRSRYDIDTSWVGCLNSRVFGRTKRLGRTSEHIPGRPSGGPRDAVSEDFRGPRRRAMH